MLGLTGLLDRRPDTLSSGERQRVALGRALVQRPDVFLLDEPLSNVDAALRLDLRRLIADLHRRLKTTTVYVTHDQVEAMTLGDRVAVIRQGQLEQVGTPAQIYDTPATAFVARFIGSPGMNLFPGKLLRDREELLFQFASSGEPSESSFPLDPDLASRAASHLGSKVLLGIRPEHIHPVDHPAAILSGLVELAERTGAETVLHLRSESVQLKLRVPGNATARIGDKLAVGFERNHIRLFDADSGRRIA
jgi:multiple sugar transport system ATP-binding protein